MNPDGGRRSASIRTVPARALWLQTHPLPTTSDKGINRKAANSLAAVEKTGVVSSGFFAGAKRVDNTKKNRKQGYFQ
jgi:hypothetical protein